MGFLKVPPNLEHYEAAQEKTNRERKELFAKQSEEIQQNQRVVEECVSTLEKQNLPFILVVNPGGYNFDKAATEPTPFGFWQYHKFYGTEELYSEKANESVVMCKKAAVHPLLSLLSYAAPGYKVVVYDLDNNAVLVAADGQSYIIPKKENE
jgi:hypothetical protein